MTTSPRKKLRVLAYLGEKLVGERQVDDQSEGVEWGRKHIEAGRADLVEICRPFTTITKPDGAEQ